MERGGSNKYALGTLRSRRTTASGCALCSTWGCLAEGQRAIKVLLAELDNQTWAAFREKAISILVQWWPPLAKL